MHLFPQFGDKRLDAITTEDVQRLKSALAAKSPKTVNNVLTVLSVMLKTAVEWGVIERVPCVIKLLKAPKTTASFHDFEEYERLVDTARTDEVAALLVVLLGGEAGLRCGEIMALEWTDVDLQQAATLRGAVRLEGPRHDAEGRAAPVRAADQAADRGAARRRDICADRGCSATEEGKPLTQKVVQVMVRRAARRANVKPGIHILRHTFCSHLAMRGAPARAIQELAGHQDLATTQRYMHLSPAALDAAIRLLETGTEVTSAAVEK